MKCIKHSMLACILAGMASLPQMAAAETAGGAGAAPVAKQAIDQQGRNAVINRRLENMTRTLGLTTEQQAAIKAILEEDYVKIKALRDATDQKIRTLLTPEQQRKEDENRIRMPGRQNPVNVKPEIKPAK